MPCRRSAHALRCAVRFPGAMDRPEMGSEVAGCLVAMVARPAAVWVHPERCSTSDSAFLLGTRWDHSATDPLAAMDVAGELH